MVIKINRRKAIFVVCVLLLLVMLIIAVRWIDFYNEKKTNLNNVDAVQAASFQLDTGGQPDFFVEYRLERDRLRAEQADVLQSELKNSTLDSERKELRGDLLELVNEKKLENDMENMIRAKGFEDAIVICRADNANAIIKAGRLNKNEVLQIADVIKRLGNIKEENIIISAK